jgi:fatty acid desaturase
MGESINPRDLVAAETLRELSAKSDGPALARLAGHLAALACTGALIWVTRGTWWVMPAMLVHGFFVVFLFNAHHECIHQSAFRTPWLNKAVNWVLGLIVFYPPEYFRYFHLTHHRFTQDRERDPEILPPPVTSRAGYVWWVAGPPYLKRRFLGSLKHALTGKVPQPFIPEQRKQQVVREARITWLVYGLVFVIACLTDPWAPLLYWLGPYILAQPLFRLYQLGEHGGAEHSDYTLLNTRTTISNPFIRWIAWNMPYHTEHHLYPGVPFHKLPRLHALVKHRLQTVSPGYLALNRDIWKGLAR